MRFAFILFSMFFADLLFASEMDSLRSEQRADGLYVIHQVEQEETLYSLSRRYKTSVKQIVVQNQIEDNRIEIGQLLEIRVDSQPTAESLPVGAMPDANDENEVSGYHKVVQGETLYGISKKYDLKVKEIKRWNDLEENTLSPGMLLKVNRKAEKLVKEKEVEREERMEISTNSSNDSAIVEEPSDPFQGFESYLVQTGETLYTIASKIGVTLDSLRAWNKLSTDYLKIGQELLFRKEGTLSNDEIAKVESTAENRTLIDENGFEKTFEEGVASVIQSMETTKYLALHRTLPIGTNLEVRNLMNNQVVHVKVVGKLPDTGMNKNVMLRLSQSAYDQLGILDSKSRVEVSYFKR